MKLTAAVLAVALLAAPAAAQPVLGGALPGSPPGPLFPPGNWWNLDVSAAPVDPNSAAYIRFVNNCTSCCPDGRKLHPDFGGDVEPGSVQTYGIPYAVVDGTQPRRSVIFHYWKESDGVDHATGASFPFYPLPDEAIGQPHWVEGGEPASVDLRSQQDRHLIVVDRDRRHLYELWNAWYDGVHGQWYAGSGAFFDLDANDRRPETWTSADAAGLAILPGLVRHDEVFHPDPAYEIPHAFRVTVRATNGHVYPASHTAGSTPGALPMGARLRLRPDRNLAGFPPEIQRIFRAMKKHGLIVADNGSDMFITGTYDTRWNNDVLNPAFRQITACDFEVVRLGWTGALTLSAGVNQPVFAVGQTLVASAGFTNPGMAGAADLYLGLLGPDGAIRFFTTGGGVTGRLADPASWAPLATGVSLAAPFVATAPGFHTSAWTGAEPRGAYVLFLVALETGTPPGPGGTAASLLGIATASFTFP